MVDTNIKLTDWSSDKATLMRLDDQLKVCHYARFTKDPEKWKSALECIYMEVLPKMSKKEVADIDKIFEEIYTLISKLNSCLYHGANPAHIKKILNIRLFYVEKELRKSADAHGMLLREKKKVLEDE